MIGNFIGAPIGGAVNTSGTLYSQTVSIAASGSTALLRATGKKAAIAVTGTVTLARAIAHALGISSTPTISAAKAVTHQGPAITGAGTVLVTFTKTILQAITATSAGIVSVSFHAGRVVMLHMTAMGAVSFARAVAKTLESAASSPAVLVIKSALKSIAAGSAASVSIKFKKALYAPLTHLASASRSLGSALFGGSAKMGSTAAGGATLMAKTGGEALGSVTAAGGKASQAQSGGEQN
jgi:hypothetical protein